jgi:hypothetical protein
MATTQAKTRSTAVTSGGKTTRHSPAAPVAAAPPKTNGQGAAPGAGTHTEHEDMPWTINIPDHPARSDSPEYVKSRAFMNQTAREIADFYYGNAPYQDHHGGGLWLKDATGWFMVKNVAGMEWSSQFCADPARVDMLRVNAKRLYALCPEAAKELGIEQLLNTPITDAAGVENWTDSICNASVPLNAQHHTGTLPQGGGVHHYPTPIVDIQFFKHIDFNLWVLDGQGNITAVVPVSPPQSGDARVQVLYSTPNSDLNNLHKQAEHAGNPLIVPPDHSLAQQAFARQTVKKAITRLPVKKTAVTSKKSSA